MTNLVKAHVKIQNAKGRPEIASNAQISFGIPVLLHLARRSVLISARIHMIRRSLLLALSVM
ncbi:MAG: hypothetical protein QF704_04065 [Anaerolineales bacterium]|nr:hypothetical protein [Anaerolineales bacterium]